MTWSTSRCVLLYSNTKGISRHTIPSKIYSCVYVCLSVSDLAFAFMFTSESNFVSVSVPALYLERRRASCILAWGIVNGVWIRLSSSFLSVQLSAQFRKYEIFFSWICLTWKFNVVDTRQVSSWLHCLPIFFSHNQFLPLYTFETKAGSW